MGVTIHIQGRLRNPRDVRALADEVADCADTLGWKVRTLFDAPLKGVCVTPHKECDGLILLFDDEGVLRNPVLHPGEHDDVAFVKTQFAPADIHVALCKLLKHLKKRYFASMEVFDDGEYWQTGDRKRLEENLRRTGAAIDALAGALGRQSKPHPEEGPEDMARRVENAAEEARAEMRDDEGGRRALDRLNGPQPPCEEEREDWDLEKWTDFWRRWDEHRSPLLASMRGKPETVDSIRAAMKQSEKTPEREDADHRAVKRRMKRLRKRRPRREIEIPDPEPEEPWKESVPTYDPGRGEEAFELLSDSFPKARDWFRRFHKATQGRAEHPAILYVGSAMLPAIVGGAMAVDWAREEGMFMAVPSRLLVCAERFEHVARILRSERGLGLEELADEAARIGKVLRREGGRR